MRAFKAFFYSLHLVSLEESNFDFRGIVMSNKSKVILVLFLGLLLSLFVMLFMGLGDKPVIVPRSAL